MSKTKLNCHDRPEWVRSMMKMRKDNNVTNRTGVIYNEDKTELT